VTDSESETVKKQIRQREGKTDLKWKRK